MRHSPFKANLEASETAVYRLYDADDNLLYVGVGVDPSTRWRAHREQKEWWRSVVKITIERHPTRVEALRAEQAAIVTEGPRYNIVYSTRSRLRALSERPSRLGWCAVWIHVPFGSHGASGARLVCMESPHHDGPHKSRQGWTWHDGEEPTSPEVAA